jgi:hypothetical protein
MNRFHQLEVWSLKTNENSVQVWNVIKNRISFYLLYMSIPENKFPSNVLFKIEAFPSSTFKPTQNIMTDTSFIDLSQSKSEKGCGCHYEPCSLLERILLFRNVQSLDWDNIPVLIALLMTLSSINTFWMQSNNQNLHFLSVYWFLSKLKVKLKENTHPLHILQIQSICPNLMNFVIWNSNITIRNLFKSHTLFHNEK